MRNDKPLPMLGILIPAVIILYTAAGIYYYFW